MDAPHDRAKPAAAGGVGFGRDPGRDSAAGKRPVVCLYRPERPHGDLSFGGRSGERFPARGNLRRDGHPAGAIPIPGRSGVSVSGRGSGEDVLSAGLRRGHGSWKIPGAEKELSRAGPGTIGDSHRGHDAAGRGHAFRPGADGAPGKLRGHGMGLFRRKRGHGFGRGRSNRPGAGGSADHGVCIRRAEPVYYGDGFAGGAPKHFLSGGRNHPAGGGYPDSGVTGISPGGVGRGIYVRLLQRRSGDDFSGGGNHCVGRGRRGGLRPIRRDGSGAAGARGARAHPVPGAVDRGTDVSIRGQHRAHRVGEHGIQPAIPV